ncbi:hypothetical protein J437_LFUL019153 [Ladona fulva]|uniref:DDE-1 domain-containing protein n=1 Tax=Ladona fulva TaxID=123851 RepID=A0A8K0KQR1_LADFU|nr:hypothetical protein J437_LFUL019153 [Ladona fulva]
MEWLNVIDQNMKRLRHKVILFLDNATCHPNFKLENVEVNFLAKFSYQTQLQCVSSLIKASSKHSSVCIGRKLYDTFYPKWTLLLQLKSLRNAGHHNVVNIFGEGNFTQHYSQVLVLLTSRSRMVKQTGELEQLIQHTMSGDEMSSDTITSFHETDVEGILALNANMNNDNEEENNLTHSHPVPTPPTVSYLNPLATQFYPTPMRNSLNANACSFIPNTPTVYCPLGRSVYKNGSLLGIQTLSTPEYLRK